jgi:hypothetical protein
MEVPHSCQKILNVNLMAKLTYYIRFFTHTHKHSPRSRSQKETFLQLFVIWFLALLLQETAESFVGLKLVHHTSWLVAHFLTGATNHDV